MHILVIEDDARVAEHIGKGLTAAGHLVDVEGDGRSGLLRAASESYDLIVVDRMLPHVDGLTIVPSGRRTALFLIGPSTPSGSFCRSPQVRP